MNAHFGSIVTAAVLASATVACADPLNLTPGSPDAAAGFIAVSYNATTHLFTANGTTQNLTPGNISLGQRLFEISATIDNSGVATGGSLMLRGDFGGTDQVLYSSNILLAFGFSATNRFEFIFRQTAGSLTLAGDQVGVILGGSGLSFPGGIPSFASNFSNEIIPGFGTATADTFRIPAPSGAAAALLGLVALRRRR